MPASSFSWRTFRKQAIAPLLLGMALLSMPAQAQLAIDFTLKSLQGQNLRLGEQRGKVVLLVFWGSWCSECRQPLQMLNRLQRRYRADGLLVWGIDMASDAAKGQRMAADLQLGYPQLLDREQRTARSYRVEALPTSLLIDRDGLIRYRQNGADEMVLEPLTQQLQGVLAE